MKGSTRLPAVLLGLLVLIGGCQRKTIAPEEPAAEPSPQRPSCATQLLLERGHISALAMAPDGKRFLVGRGYQTSLHELETGKLVWSTRGGSNHIHYPAVSRDGRFALSLTRLNLGESGNGVQLRDTRDGRLLREWAPHDKTRVFVAAFSQDGRRAVTASGPRTGPEMRLWDLSTGRMLTHFDEGHLGGITSVAFSPDDKLALSGSLDHTIRLWDVATGEELHCFEGEHKGQDIIVAFSPNGRRALSSCGWRLCVWDLPGRKLLWAVQGTGWREAAFTRNGNSILTAGVERPTGDQTNKKEEPPKPATFFVLTCDAATGKEQSRFETPLVPPPDRRVGVRLIAFHPDGDRVLTAERHHDHRRDEWWAAVYLWKLSKPPSPR
jgi:WD40 repeat protein